MMEITQEQIENLTKDEASSLINRRVYAATRLLEQLEQAGKLSGNFHHVRQYLADSASIEVMKRWIETND